MDRVKSYSKPPKLRSTYVSYTLEGEDLSENKMARDLFEFDAKPGSYEHEGCFATITYYPVSKKIKSILVYQPVNTLAYAETEIRRWIADINEVGFPCTIEEFSTTLKVRVNLENYTKKEHWVSTLYLIRVLWETGRNDVPDLYFQAMDDNPMADKLIEIQKAHKQYKGSYIGGHVGITYKDIIINVTREEFLKNLEDFGHSPYGKETNVPRIWGLKECPGYM